MTIPAPPRLLEGVRVIDLTWILVGAGATRLLASMGAEVIRIEPTDMYRLDLARYVPLQRLTHRHADPYTSTPWVSGVSPWRFHHRAPGPGEHNTEIYVQELGMHAETVARLCADRVV